MSKGKVSIVVPMYNEQESLGILYQELNRVTNTIKDYEFEYLFVNDGSKDNTLQEIQKLAAALYIAGCCDAGCKSQGSGRSSLGMR